MMEIRKMIEKDINQIHEIESEAFSVPWTIESIMMEVINKRSHYLVIDLDGEIVGYAGLWKIFDEGHINNIAIKKCHRNKGLGRLLMEALIAQSKTHGMMKFTLEVRVSNNQAIKLYEGLGFKEEGIRKEFYNDPKENAIIMWRDL